MPTPGSREETKRNVVDRCDDSEGVYELIDDDDNDDAVFELRAAEDFDIEYVMSASGWDKIGTGNWKKAFRGATSVGRPPIGTMTRRVTRDIDTGALMEDLTLSALVPEKRINKKLSRPRNVEVEVHMGEDHSEDWLDLPMSGKEQSLYRAVTARINFLALDRADLQYASKECSRYMSAPLNRHWVALKRIGRYLLGKPRVVTSMRGRTRPRT